MEKIINHVQVLESCRKESSTGRRKATSLNKVWLSKLTTASRKRSMRTAAHSDASNHLRDTEAELETRRECASLQAESVKELEESRLSLMWKTHLRKISLRRMKNICRNSRIVRKTPGNSCWRRRESPEAENKSIWRWWWGRRRPQRRSTSWRHTISSRNSAFWTGSCSVFKMIQTNISLLKSDPQIPEKDCLKNNNLKICIFEFCSVNLEILRLSYLFIFV